MIVWGEFRHLGISDLRDEGFELGNQFGLKLIELRHQYGL
jgi:hypothetical protein